MLAMAAKNTVAALADAFAALKRGGQARDRAGLCVNEPGSAPTRPANGCGRTGRPATCHQCWPTSWRGPQPRPTKVRVEKCREYGKDRELTGADRDSQEVSVLALHLLQSALIYVNTLLLQCILADQPINLTAEDRRALSPLFWTHVRPYGTFQLHLDRRLDLNPHPVSA